jgi:pyrroloquinoline quinone biosynthesis protein E
VSPVLTPWPLDSSSRPRLAAGVRIQGRPRDGRTALLWPEGGLWLDETGAAILSLCDGRRTIDEIASILAATYDPPLDVLRADILDSLKRLSAANRPQGAPAPAELNDTSGIDPHPLGLLAELTHRCPLGCPYCSNPTRYGPVDQELSTTEWHRVFEEAGELGVLHALLSGGEPLLRPDLADLVAAAREAGLYTNLITSGLGLTPWRAENLKRAGLDSAQISLQADDADIADWIAGVPAHAAKLKAARLVRELGLPLTINVVIHRHNIDRVASIIQLAESLGAHRLEVANVQFYGWAFQNRDRLLPTRAQIEQAECVVAQADIRLQGRMTILYVQPDYFGDRPKACMGGWGRRYLTVDPIGDVLPCPTARAIPELWFDNVRRRSLAWIWHESEAFNRFRGTGWMPEPCRSCDRRAVDFGGCRCQAALLTGDANATDPACSLSPHRDVLKRALRLRPVDAEAPPLVYREGPGRTGAAQGDRDTPPIHSQR